MYALTVYRYPQIHNFLFSVEVKFISTVRPKETQTEHFVSYLQIITMTKRTITVLQMVFNPLRTKLYLSEFKTQFVPRSKHSLPQLYKPIS
jgi:hypothetical protein